LLARSGKNSEKRGKEKASVSEAYLEELKDIAYKVNSRASAFEVSPQGANPMERVSTRVKLWR